MTTTVNSFELYEPLHKNRFMDPLGVLGSLGDIANHGTDYDAAMGAAPDPWKGLWTALHNHLDSIDDPDETVHLLARFLDSSSSPASLLALFERDRQALPTLLQTLSSGPALAKVLISDPDGFDWILASDARPNSPEVLYEELATALRTSASDRHAAAALGRLIGRETMRIAHGEFFGGFAPDEVARQISRLSDAALATALDFTIEQVAGRFNYPQRIDASEPKYAIIALGDYGGEEIGYDSPLDLLLLCDQIDRKNESHLKFNRHVVGGLLNLLRSDRGRVVSLHLRFVQQPGEELERSAVADAHRLSESIHADDLSSRQIEFHAANDVAAYYERENHTFQRLAFVKARVAAGDHSLGNRFLQRMESWIYPRILRRSEMVDFRVLRQKLETRALSTGMPSGIAIADCPGGRRDIERTIQVLQLLHGGEICDVRVPGTLDAIAALNRHGCLTQQDAAILAENHARLCRLEHHLAVLLDHRLTHLPDDNAIRTRLAWRLGVRKEADRAIDGGDVVDGTAAVGDCERFERLLDETFAANRKIIHHLMTQEVAGILARTPDIETPATSIPRKLVADVDTLATETELILDPEPDLDVFADVLRRHGFINIDHVLKQISSLSHETVPFLSPRPARHLFASVAPHLLREIGQTPAPDQTLDRLVEIADSIGAKATLWELLKTNQTTRFLMVNLCSLAPYLANILTENPGMIDELIDSLRMDRLPPPERIDTQSIRLCQIAGDLTPILSIFRAGCHLTIGARDLLGRESVDAIGQSLSDTAEACLRRVIESEHERLAARLGDPVNELNEPVEMVAVALGTFGERELSYHSELELTFLYTADGETRRRVGGPRATLSNGQFFHQLAQNVVRKIDSAGDRLYKINLPLAQGADGIGLAYSLDQFIRRSQFDGVPLWRWAAWCHARPISGSRRTRDLVEAAIVRAIGENPWRASHLAELKTLRQREESAAAPGDLKRGFGGTRDVQSIVTAGILKSGGLGIEIDTGISAALTDLAAAGVYDESDVEKLINNARYLRTVEAKGDLIKASARHELPLSAGGSADPFEMNQLAALLGESDPLEIIRGCDEARDSNRQFFERLLALSSPRSLPD